MKSIYAILTIMLLSACLLAACSSTTGAPPTAPTAKPSNATVTDGKMTTSVNDDSVPTGPVTSTFSPDTKAIYVSFKVSGVEQDDMIKASWYYLKGEAAGKENILLNETFTTAQADTGSYNLAFYLDAPNAGTWDKGDYKVVISVNSIEKLSVPFTVQ